MIPKTQRATPSTALVPPGIALCFSLLMIWLAPRYEMWFGALPKFTQNFFEDYPIMIGISAIALTSVLIARQFPALAERCALCRAVDVLLAVASLMIVAVGLIALFWPIFLRADV